MTLPAKARIHCATCAQPLLEARNPIGVIVCDRTPHTVYHFVRGNWLGSTICGIEQVVFSTRIGTYGIEITAGDLVHEWLTDLEACSTCAKHVW